MGRAILPPARQRDERAQSPGGIGLAHALRDFLPEGSMPKAATRQKTASPPAIPKDERPLPDGDITRSVSMSSEPNEQDIRLRAYHRYLERGQQPGMDFDDWIAAKRDLESRNMSDDANRQMGAVSSPQEPDRGHEDHSQG
jgi:hypothetical protein